MLAPRQHHREKRRPLNICFALVGLTKLLSTALSGVFGDALGVMIINVDTAMYLLAGMVVLSATSKRLLESEVTTS